MNSLFCRHNRFTAECPICSKGSVLAAEARTKPEPRPRPSSKPKSRAQKAMSSATRGPFASTGPLDRDGRLYEVRLEKVLGGLRLGEWRDGLLEKHAPELPPSELRHLLAKAAENNVIGFREWDSFREVLEQQAGEGGGVAASPGRAGDLQEELRIDQQDEGRVRIARWLYWPGGGVGWELQDAPVMYAEGRYVEALRRAVELGLI